jgi:hypothetical protein
MKNLIYLATIATTVLLAPAAVRAQPYPYGGSTTTIYVPPIESSTTTTQISPNIYQSRNGVTTTTTYYGGYPNTRTTNYYGTSPNVNGYYGANDPRINNYYYRQYQRQPTIILQQNIYPVGGQSSCSTAIIGSPIPSPVALDRSGRPCR